MTRWNPLNFMLQFIFGKVYDAAIKSRKKNIAK